MKGIFSKILKLFIVLTICVAGAVLLPSYSVEAASVKLSATKKTLYTGEKFTLTLKNAKSTVKWKSSNTKVATVDSNGKVKAVGTGTAKITAKYKSATYTCKVTVKTPHISCKDVTLYVDGTLQLEMFGTKAEEYKSSNTSVAKVSGKGLITAVDTGKASVEVLCSDGKTYTCTVSVENPSEKAVVVNELTTFYSNNLYHIRTEKFWDVSVDYDYLDTDNLGNKHTDIYNFESYNDDAEITYKLNKNYSYISGTLYLTQKHRSTSYEYQVTIYGDDSVLWTGTITAGLEPVSFKVSVKSVDKLEIKGNLGETAVIGEFRLTP